MNMQMRKLWACLAMLALAGCSRAVATGPEPNMADAEKLRAALSSTKAAKPGAGDAAEKTASSAKKFDGWATLKGRFIFEGGKPTPPPIKVTKDQEVCGVHPLINESVLVGSDNGLANVIVFVRTPKLPVNEEYAKSASDKIVMDNKDCHFVPHVVGVRVGQTLVLKNSDPVAHNSNIQGNLLKANPLIPAGRSFETKIDAQENLPAIVTCNIHDWMKGWLVVRPDPYFAISDASGHFEIHNLPAGDLELQAVHEAAGALAVNRSDLNWNEKGRFQVSLKNGEEKDLKDIPVTAAALKIQ
jgi:plastocyanin